MTCSVQFAQGVSIARIDPWNPNNIVVASASGYIDVFDVNEASSSSNQRESQGVQVSTNMAHFEQVS
jgi:hypothetical protein